jgi:murein DD-endopeptidase / murein LD-carboxypeptidase
MVKQLLPALAFIIFLSSCSTLKPLNFTSNKQVMSSAAPAKPSKFIEEISVTPEVNVDKTEVKETVDIWTAAAKRKAAAKENIQAKEESKETIVNKGPNKQEEVNQQLNDVFANRKADVESASQVQLKYAILMNTEVENLPNKSLLEAVDEWYGVHYRTGGNTKSGVDCSGFSVAVYAAAFGYALPRVSKEQYRTSRHISMTELQEGDLVFFNTRGSGVSHVGVYLGNNKFIHASVSRGVMVSDLFEPYYIKRFFGAGRFDDKQFVASN